MDELEAFKDFARYFLEEFSLTHLGTRYEVTDYQSSILIRNKKSPQTIDGIPYYNIAVIIGEIE